MLRTLLRWVIVPSCLMLLGACGARVSNPEPSGHDSVAGGAGTAGTAGTAAAASIAGARAAEMFPDKGPAHALPLPAPGEQPWHYLDDDLWRYVAPEDAGRLYDATFFDGRYFVLHGKIENSEKVTLSELNWLSWTRDGLNWDTITLTDRPYESYNRLASNGESLLLSGSRHVGKLVGDKVEPIAALEQNVAPPVLLPYSTGWAIARQDDIQWLDDSGALKVVFMQSLAQFRAGVAREAGARSLLAGPFGAFSSIDGKQWTPIAAPDCDGCNNGITYGNHRYLAADPISVFASDDGTSWNATAWPPANDSAGPTPDESDENRIERIDFTGGHFIAALENGSIRLSLDGLQWSDQLKIPATQIGPAACNGRCYVAAGHILRAPLVQ